MPAIVREDHFSPYIAKEKRSRIRASLTAVLPDTRRRTCQKGRRGPEMIARSDRARRWERQVFPSRKVISTLAGRWSRDCVLHVEEPRSELKANRSSTSGRVKDHLSESWCCRGSLARSSLSPQKSAHRAREAPRSRGRPRGCRVSFLPIKRLFINDCF